MLENKHKILFIFLLLTTNLFAQDFWTPIGEGGGIYGSFVTALTIDSDGDLYAGTYGGIFKSTNNGDLWEPLGFEDQIIDDVLILDDKEIILTCAMGLFFSTDKGKTWTNGYNIYTAQINKFCKGNDGEIYAATNGSPYILDKNTKSWSAITPLDIHFIDYGAEEVVVDSTGTVFAAVANNEVGGLFRKNKTSTDWEEITPPSGTKVVKSIKFDKNERLWAGTGNGLYFTDDKGDSWEKISSFPNIKINSINFSQIGSMYIGVDWGLVELSDNGSLWNTIFYKKVFDTVILNDNSIFVATMRGVFYKEVNNEQWVEKNIGITSAFTYDMEFTNDGTFYIATSVGLFSSTDNGYSFKLELQEFGGKDIDAKTIFINDNGDIFIGTSFKGIYSKISGSNNWKHTSAKGIITNIVQHPTGVLFAGSSGNGMYYSVDNGNTWLLTAIPNNVSVNSIIITNDGSIYACVTKADENPWFIGFYYSNDVGKTWNRKVFESYYGVGQQIWGIAKSSNDEIYAGTSQGIYRSKDNCLSWEKVKDNVSIQDIIISNDQKLFTGTWKGILQSTNNGDNWTQLSRTGLKSNRISCLAISPDGYLYVGTFSSGGSKGGATYRSLQKVSQATKIDEDKNLIENNFVLHQNYPNPFNPSTTIRYTLPENSNVKIRIFNGLGQDIITLVDEVQTKGAKSVVWNGKNQNGDFVTSGVYIYRIDAGNIAESKTMLLLK